MIFNLKKRFNRIASALGGLFERWEIEALEDQLEDARIGLRIKADPADYSGNVVGRDVVIEFFNPDSEEGRQYIARLENRLKERSACYTKRQMAHEDAPKIH